MERGVVLTITSTLLLAGLILYGSFWITKVQNSEQAIAASGQIPRAELVTDDVATDLNVILNKMSYNQTTPNEVTLFYTGKSPDFRGATLRNVSDDLQTYAKFVSNLYNRTNVKVSLDMGSLINGNIETDTSEGIQLLWNYTNWSSVLWQGNRGANFTLLNLTANVNASFLKNATGALVGRVCDPGSGNIAIDFRISDVNGTSDSCTGSTSLDYSGKYEVKFEDGSKLTLNFGNYTGMRGSLNFNFLNESMTYADYSVQAKALIAEQKPALRFNAMVNVTAGGVTKNGLVEIAK